MATDLPRLSRRARALFALATVAALGWMGIAAIVEIANPEREYEPASRYVQSGKEYFVVADIFWEGARMSGHWYAPLAPGGPPEQVRLVAGSDVARILAGQPPEHVYKDFPPIRPGLWVGDVSFIVPRFTCSGPTGGCERGDLPAIVFTRGDAWVGTPESSLLPADEVVLMPHVALVEHDAWVLPAIVWTTALATACALAAVAAGITWWVTARRLPKATPIAAEGAVPLETSLRLVDLSRLYLASITRSLYGGGALLLVGGIALQLWGIPRIGQLLENNLPLPSGSDVAAGWLDAMHWLIVPFGLFVAGVFWVRNLRQLRAEQRRWDAVAGRLASFEQKVLG